MTEENNIENINNITENPEITEIIENTENSSLDIEPNLINETQSSDEVQKITPAPIIKKLFKTDVRLEETLEILRALKPRKML